MFVLADVPRVFHASESACAALWCCNKTLPFLDSIVLPPRLPSAHTDTPVGIGRFPTAHFRNKSRTVTGIEKKKSLTILRCSGLENVLPVWEGSAANSNVDILLFGVSSLFCVTELRVRSFTLLMCRFVFLHSTKQTKKKTVLFVKHHVFNVFI